MQKILLFLSFLLNGWNWACAQNSNPIVVQHGDSLRYATSLDNALSIAAAGDAIYLPAGSFSTQSGISKKVSIYGVGYRRDSAHISGVTVIQGNVNVLNNASGTLISGVHVINSVAFMGVVSGFTLSNCKISSIVPSTDLYEDVVSGTCRWDGDIANVTIKESILGSIMTKSNYASWCNHRIYFNIQNSIIESSMYGDYINISNCVILNSNTSAAFTVSAANVTNSIIYPNYANTISNSYFTNNLVVGNSNFGIDTSQRQNLYRPLTYRDTVFKTNTTTNFNEENDYHTKDTCTVCNDKGIYWGATPYKPLPANPHLVSKVIPNSVNGQSLRFEIRVRLSNQ